MKSHSRERRKKNAISNKEDDGRKASSNHAWLAVNKEFISSVIDGARSLLNKLTFFLFLALSSACKVKILSVVVLIPTVNI